MIKSPIFPSTPCVFPLQVIDRIKVISFGKESFLLRVNDFSEPVLWWSSTEAGISCKNLSRMEDGGVTAALDGFWLRVFGHNFFFCCSVSLW